MSLHCECVAHESSTFSPLAELLPDHTTPELLFLETKWAALMSYGMTAQLLEDVLPMDEPMNAFTIRRHVWDVAERLENNWVRISGASVEPISCYSSGRGCSMKNG